MPIEPIRANVPTLQEGLVSPGMEKFGSGVVELLRGYLNEISETASLPGRIYKGEAKATPTNTFKFASMFAGGGFGTGTLSGRGGFGMGGRLSLQKRRYPSVSVEVKPSIPNEQTLIKELLKEAETQGKISKIKFLKKHTAELGKSFEKQVIEYGGLPKEALEARAFSDQGLTDTATQMLKYRKLLEGIKKEWI